MPVHELGYPAAAQYSACICRIPQSKKCDWILCELRLLWRGHVMQHPQAYWLELLLLGCCRSVSILLRYRLQTLQSQISR